MDIENLLYDLTQTHSAGHINFSATVLKKVLEKCSKVTLNDSYLKAEVGESFQKSVMLEAHLDQVAMIVTCVYDSGFLRVSPVGAIDGRILPATPVLIYGKEILKGVFTSIPPHLKKEDVTPNFDNLFVDTGNLNAKNLISEGDLVFFDYPPAKLANNRFAASGLDDKAGCACAVSAFCELARLNLPIHITLMLSMGEELGLRGAAVGAYKEIADSCIAVDVSFGNHPEIPSHKTAPLGSGAMIGISPILSKRIYTALLNIAKENNIPFSTEVMGGKTGTDADVISITKGGIPTALLSIPLRNMHCPLEVVDLKDLNAVTKLLVNFVKEEAENA